MWIIFSRGLEIKNVGGLKISLELSTWVVNDDRIEAMSAVRAKIARSKSGTHSLFYSTTKKTRWPNNGPLPFLAAAQDGLL